MKYERWHCPSCWRYAYNTNPKDFVGSGQCPACNYTEYVRSNWFIVLFSFIIDEFYMDASYKTWLRTHRADCIQVKNERDLLM